MDGGASTTDAGRDRFAALSAAASACAAVEVVDLTDGEVLHAVLGLAVAVGQVEACLARASASVRSRSLHTLDRARSAESWLAGRTELSHGRAKALVGIGRQLPACAHVEAAYASGRLGTAKVELLVGARDRVEGLFAEHEAELVEQVAPLTVRQAKVLLAHWRVLALATVGADEGTDPSADDTLNRLHVSPTFLGRFRIDGDLDAITGQRLADRLSAERDARFRSGEWTPTDGLTTSQRNAIVLADLLDGVSASDDAGADGDTDAAGEPSGTKAKAAATRGGRARPAITIHWDARHLLGDAADGVADVLRRRCVLGEEHVLGRSVAERLLCSADVTEVLAYFGADGTTQPLGVVHHRRLPTPAERAALVARDGGCVFPGCEVPAAWTDAHHTVPYERGKRTALHELVLLCRDHHHAVHEGGYCLWRTPEGHVHVRDPDGHALPEAERGHKLPPPPPPEQRPKTVFRARQPGSPPKPPPGHGLAA